nr:MAG TPA_asm: hypothetical protein [Caudoviricetes sp.]
MTTLLIGKNVLHYDDKYSQKSLLAPQKNQTIVRF